MSSSVCGGDIGHIAIGRNTRCIVSWASSKSAVRTRRRRRTSASLSGGVTTSSLTCRRIFPPRDFMFCYGAPTSTWQDELVVMNRPTRLDNAYHSGRSPARIEKRFAFRE